MYSFCEIQESNALVTIYLQHAIHSSLWLWIYGNASAVFQGLLENNKWDVWLKILFDGKSFLDSVLFLLKKKGYLFLKLGHLSQQQVINHNRIFGQLFLDSYCTLYERWEPCYLWHFMLADMNGDKEDKFFFHKQEQLWGGLTPSRYWLKESNFTQKSQTWDCTIYIAKLVRFGYSGMCVLKLLQLLCTVLCTRMV